MGSTRVIEERQTTSAEQKALNLHTVLEMAEDYGFTDLCNIVGESIDRNVAVLTAALEPWKVK